MFALKAVLGIVKPDQGVMRCSLNGNVSEIPAGLQVDMIARMDNRVVQRGDLHDQIRG